MRSGGLWAKHMGLKKQGAIGNTREEQHWELVYVVFDGLFF
jgi:hypothetical protein